MSKEKYLAGQLAVVTGASKVVSIGSATALALAEHGANVLFILTFLSISERELTSLVNIRY
jgi:NAD(P)-dependent dehydrogenase (short-subunit alcohol dehydrogenase family)